MPDKISSLTAAQEQRLIEIEEEWLAAGRNTSPVNRARAAAVIGDMYQVVGRPAPKVLFFSSPIMCILAAAALRETATTAQNGKVSTDLSTRFCTELFVDAGGILPCQLYSDVDEKLLPRICTDLTRRISGQIEIQIQGPLITQIFADLATEMDPALYPQLESQLSSQVENISYEPVNGSLSRHVTSQLHGGLFCWGGQLAHASMATYAFAREIGVSIASTTLPLLDLSLREFKELYYWFPFDSLVLASDRPRQLHLDESGRLHRLDERAMEFSDGWGVYAWHGTRLPPSCFQRQPGPAEILAEANAEVRRCLIERYDESQGKGTFMRECGARVLDSRTQPMHNGGPPTLNELLAVDLPDDPEGCMVALRVVCPSTGREYMIRVPPNQTTVAGALAWTFALEPEEYDLAQET